MMYRTLERNILSFCLCASVLYCGVQACGTSSNDPWTVQLPTSTTPIDTRFNATIAGASKDRKYSIDIVGNAGKVTQNNRTTDVTVQYQIPFGGSLVLYSLTGTDADHIVLGWAYCTGDYLETLFLESTDGTSGFTNSTVTGSCNITNQTTSANLVTNSECLSVTQLPAVPTIDGGDQLSLQNGSVGDVRLTNEEFNLIPFAVVDCSDCAATKSGGWFEVHSVMTSKTSADVCLGIFYLDVACNGHVVVEYVQCLLGNATSHTFNAGYDLSILMKNSTEAANATCKANSNPSSGGNSNTAGPGLRIPFSALLTTLVIGWATVYI
jgi:hypothetical protein